MDRHPYEKVVSLAFWRGRNMEQTAEAFADYVDATIDAREYRNFGLYPERGAPIVDEVIRYESLWMRLEALADRLGERLPTELPRSAATSSISALKT